MSILKKENTPKDVLLLKEMQKKYLELLIGSKKQIMVFFTLCFLSQTSNICKMHSSYQKNLLQKSFPIRLNIILEDKNALSINNCHQIQKITKSNSIKR